MTQTEACNKYIKEIKRFEPDLPPDQLALAREAFNEGWLQRGLSDGNKTSS